MLFLRKGAMMPRRLFIAAGAFMIVLCTSCSPTVSSVAIPTLMELPTAGLSDAPAPSSTNRIQPTLIRTPTLTSTPSATPAPTQPLDLVGSATAFEGTINAVYATPTPEAAGKWKSGSELDALSVFV